MRQPFTESTSEHPTPVPEKLSVKGLNKGAYRKIFFAAKILITVLMFWYLYRHVWLKKDFFDNVALLRKSLSGTRPILLLGVSILLIGFNWGFEALKWQWLVSKFYKVSFSTSFRAILAGNSISLWIPNRTGEYLGRILYVPSEVRVKGILATLVGSAAQLAITLIMGGGGLLFYIYFQLKNFYLFLGTGLMVLISGAVLLFLYFHIQRVRRFIPHYDKLKKIRKYARIYREYAVADLSRVLLYSLIRYLIFCTQFLLLTRVFGANIPIVDGFFLLFLIYLIQTAVPTTALTELGMRGVTTVFFFQVYTSNIAAVLAASYTLWVINLAVPGIIGLGFLLAAQLYKDK